MPERADIERVLGHYGINGRVGGERRGPLLQLTEFEPAAGTKIKKLASALDDIARELKVSSVNVEPVPGSNSVWLEIPAETPETVDFASLADSRACKEFKAALPLCLGVDVRGEPVTADLAKMPHLLVAGTTGSGKSVGLNTFILSLIKAKKPEEVRFVLIDPKRVEFGIYDNQQYMLAPVVTDNRQAVEMLARLADEMERRYLRLRESMTRNIAEYHSRVGLMPYIVCIIDEFADLAATGPEAEKYVRLLAQKARACGIHLIVATQRPSVDVVAGVLKADFPCRLAYKTASAADSRTILDTGGAEKLLGRGDALYLDGRGRLLRLHGAYVADNDIRTLLEPWRGKAVPLLPEKPAEREKQTEIPVAGKQEPGIFRRLLGWWSSLKVRERKSIISGLSRLFNGIVGRRSRK